MVQVGDQTECLSAGDAAFAPSGIVHAIRRRSNSSRPAYFFVGLCAASISDWVSFEHASSMI
jgi:hypothetical protein